jgi:hypothetical protein
MFQAILTAFVGTLLVVSGVIGMQAVHDRIAHPPIAFTSDHLRPSSSAQTAAASQSSNISQSHQTTLSEEVKQPALAPNHPAGLPSSNGTASLRAVSNKITSSPFSGAVLGTSTSDQPIIQTVYQTVGGITEAELNSRLNALTASFGSQLYGPSYPAPAQTPNDGGLLATIGMVGRVENLSGTKLSNITVTGVSGLTDADIPDGITASNYLLLSGGTLTGSLIGTDLTLSGNLTAGTLSVAGLASGGAVAAPYFSATSTSASSTFTNFNATNSTTTNATSTNLFSNLARFTTGVVDTLAATNASTTNLSSSYASSTQGFLGSLSIASLSGFLKATAGAVSTALIDLAANVTGILPTANGGTGWSNVAAGALVLGNGTGALATTSAGTNGQVLALVSGTPTWVATTSLSTIGGTLNVSSGGTGQTSFTSSQLLYGNGTNGLSSVATSSASCSSGISCSSFTVVGAVAPSITNTGLLSLTQNGGGSTQTGAITLATSSATTFNGLTITNAITNSSGTFTFSPDTITGTLNVAGGGTGLASYTLGTVLYASGATTLAGTTTANLKATLALNNVENTALSTWAGATNLTTLGTITSGTWNGTTIAVANGGTGWATINSGTLLYGNGSSALSTTTAGTAGFVLALSGGIPTWVATSTLSTISGTLGIANGGTATTTFYNSGVVFSDGTKLTQSAAAANFFWDETNKRLGIATTSPSTKLHIWGGASGKTLPTFGAGGGLLVETSNTVNTDSK